MHSAARAHLQRRQPLFCTACWAAPTCIALSEDQGEQFLQDGIDGVTIRLRTLESNAAGELEKGLQVC